MCVHCAYSSDKCRKWFGTGHRADVLQFLQPTPLEALKAAPTSSAHELHYVYVILYVCRHSFRINSQK